MRTIRDLYNDSIEYQQTILREIIELLVIEKGVLSFEDTEQQLFEKFLNAKTESYKKRLNRRYRECLEDMRRKTKREG